MPIPQRRSGESVDNYIERCMSDSKMQEEFPNREQRHAVCLGQINSANMQILSKIQVNDYTANTITHDGITYLTAPVVLITQGVHHGSGGPIFYPADELARAASAWNGVPLPVNHPDDGNGNFISANSPEVLRTWCVGRLFNVRWDAQANKLRGELWIDVNRCQRIAPNVLSRLRNGQPMEVSTGLFSDFDATPGTFNGEDYIGIARNHRPDHLALLPDSIGACSIADGCGVRTNQKGVLPMKRNEIRITKGEESFAFTANESRGWKNLFGILSNEVGFREIGMLIQRKLDTMDRHEPMQKIHFLEELFENDFVYRVHMDEGVFYFRRGYSVNQAGEVQFSDQVTQVRPEMTWPTVTQQSITGNEEAKPDTNTETPSCGCATGKTTNNKQEEDDMNLQDNRKTLLNTLVSNKKIAALEDAQIEEIINLRSCEEFGNKVSELIGANTAVEEPKVPAETPAATEPPVEELTDNGDGEEVPEVNQEAIDYYNQKKKSLIETLSTNGKFTAEELGGMKVSVLEKMSEALTTTPTTNATVEETALVAPVMNFSGKAAADVKFDANGGGEKPLEAPTMNFGKK